MVATNINLTGSTTNFSEFGFSGTNIRYQGAAQLVLLCGQSGLSVIPLACDSRGILLVGSTI